MLLRRQLKKHNKILPEIPSEKASKPRKSARKSLPVLDTVCNKSKRRVVRKSENTKNNTESNTESTGVSITPTLTPPLKTPYKSLRKNNKPLKNTFVNFAIKNINPCPSVLGRELESSLINSQISSFLKNNGNNLLYLTGVPGSGKTFTAVSILKHFNVPFSYINTASLRTRNCIYSEISKSLPCLGRGDPSVSRLRHHLSACDSPHILVIDEIDFLITKNEHLLYNIFELPLIEKSSVFMIVISNTLGSLSPKVESRIAKNRVEFRPYSAEQLISISRAEIGREGRRVDESTLELIAKRIASSTGDVRRVMEIIETPPLSLSAASIILKDIFMPLLNRFFKSFTFYQKVVFYLNTEPLKSIFQWFDDFKSFCRMREYPSVDFSDFQGIVNELVGFDVYKIRKDGIMVVCNYLKEEMEMAMAGDEITRGVRE